MAKPMIADGLAPEELRAALDYDPETGVFRWRDRTGEPYFHRKLTGKEAGHHCPRLGYVLLCFKRRLYRAHRLAWLHVHGVWPNGFIDHVDGDGFNNRLANLREASPTENNINRPAPARNTSGFKGASWSNTSQKWLAHISYGGKAYHLGFFDTVQEAHAAYLGAAKILHGEFARTA
jgi:hypothetical protein